MSSPIPYHTIRNFVNTPSQHLSPDASERFVSRLPLRNPTTLVSNHQRCSVRYGEAHGVWTDHGDIWNGNQIGGYGEVQARVDHLIICSHFQK